MLEHTAAIASELGKPVALVIADHIPDNDKLLKASAELHRQCVRDGFAVFPTISRAARVRSAAWWTTIAGARKRRRGWPTRSVLWPSRYHVHFAVDVEPENLSSIGMFGAGFGCVGHFCTRESLDPLV